MSGALVGGPTIRYDGGRRGRRGGNPRPHRMTGKRKGAMPLGGTMKLLTSAALAALRLGLGAAAQADTVKVGIILPFAGVNADLGDASKKGFDRYLKLHANDIAPHKVEIVERDEGPPSGANAKTVA